jgi:hypothetical protein
VAVVAVGSGKTKEMSLDGGERERAKGWVKNGFVLYNKT